MVMKSGWEEYNDLAPLLGPQGPKNQHYFLLRFKKLSLSFFAFDSFMCTELIKSITLLMLLCPEVYLSPQFFI